MEEIKIGVGVNAKSLSEYFSRIGTIDIKDEIIIITGAAKKTETNPNGYEIIVVGVKDDSGNYTYHAVQNGTFTGIINDACIIGSYYYIVGKGGGTTKPWIAAISLDALKSVAQSNDKIIIAATETDTEGKKAKGSFSSSKDRLLWIETDVELYAIAGRDTK